jgi:predicted AlkP superfamily phosphohydrolase/phosphomutase
MKGLQELINWQQTSVYAITPSSNGLFIRLSGDGRSPGVAAEDYVEFRDQLVRHLREIRDEQTDEPIVMQALLREDAFAGSQMRLAPDITLVLRDFAFISVLNSRSPLKRRPEPKGVHRPEGVFLASGPGIRRGVRIQPLSIMDVFPALLESLQLEVPTTIDGRLPADIFDTFAVSERGEPVRPTISFGQQPTAEQEPAYTAAEEEAVLARLQGLGYIE